MADKILIVDDDPAICKLLEKVMHSNELETTTVNCGMDALSILKNHTFDLILMDIMLGDMEGFEVIKRLRNQGISTPVMIVSGRNEDYDSLYGLSLGADDYITKPFRPLVLGAKVKALIRRNKNLVLDNSDTLECGPFSYDTTTMRFYKNGEELILSSKESALLLLFMKHPQQVFTKDMIYEHVWGNTVAVDDNAIMVYINRLRGKIEDDRQNPAYILTIRGSSSCECASPARSAFYFIGSSFGISYEIKKMTFHPLICEKSSFLFLTSLVQSIFMAENLIPVLSYYTLYFTTGKRFRIAPFSFGILLHSIARNSEVASRSAHPPALIPRFI